MSVTERASFHLQQQPQPSTEDTCPNAIESALIDVITPAYERPVLPTDVNLKKPARRTRPPRRKSPPSTENCSPAFFRRGGVRPEASGGAFRPPQHAGADHRLHPSSSVPSCSGWNASASRLLLSCHLRGISEGDDYDYANILQAEWSWPPESEQVRTESFLELYEQAAVYAEQLILGFLSGESMKTLVGERTFLDRAESPFPAEQGESTV